MIFISYPSHKFYFSDVSSLETGYTTGYILIRDGVYDGVYRVNDGKILEF